MSKFELCNYAPRTTLTVGHNRIHTIHSLSRQYTLCFARVYTYTYKYVYKYIHMYIYTCVCILCIRWSILYLPTKSLCQLVSAIRSQDCYFCWYILFPTICSYYVLFFLLTCSAWYEIFYNISRGLRGKGILILSFDGFH